jgi:CheY-like chemotaxis protein
MRDIGDVESSDVPAAIETLDRRRRKRPQAILVADDNDDVRQLWRECLTLAGYAVTEAVDGAGAVAKALLFAPDVILMDFSMPGMDGVQAAHALKLHARTRTTPVIGLTAHTGSATAEFRRVCDTVLEKPVNPDDLLAALRRALRWDVPPLSGV